MRAGSTAGDRNLTNGPGKLCEAFAIGKASYAADLCRGPLFLSQGTRPRVARSPRVGIDYAGAWAEKPWRFFERESPWVSRAPRSRDIR